MSRMKKFMSLLMAAVMVLSVMTVNVFAEGEGSITIKDSADGEEYSIYKLFDMTYSGDKYSYKVTDEWSTFFETGDGAAYVDLDDDGYITNASDIEESDAAAIAKLASKKLDGKTTAATETGTGSDIVIDGLELGYYLVTSTLGTSGTCMLNNTNLNGEVTDKNVIPRIEKGVDEDSTSALKFVAYNHAEIGQVVDFQIVLHSEAAPNDYELTDELPAGMTLVDGSVKVYKYDKDTVIPENPADADLFTAYTITTDADGFTIDFTDANDDIVKADQIVVRYQAKVTEDAAISSPDAVSENTNTATLAYESKTLSVSTNTYTFEIPVYKFYEDEDSNKVDLAGAEFKLQDAETEKWANVDANGVLTGWADEEKDGTALTSDSDGKFSFVGLDDGTYKLKETAAPSGYNKLSSDIDVTFTVTENADGTAVTEFKVNNTTQIEVENKTGAELPETGGIGTVIFRVGGAALIIAAVAMLLAKKRSNNI